MVPVPPHLLHGGLLQERLVVMAGTPDVDDRVGTDLIVIAQLAARLITVVDHASVTARSGADYATVAASDDRVVAIDQAQYLDDAGPCLEALDAGYPAAVPDVAAVTTWPGYRRSALERGMHTSLSLPLFAGSGTTIAALNLYSHKLGSLAPLTTAAWAAFDQDPAPWDRDQLDPGSRELAGALIAAHAIRAMIRRAELLLTEHGLAATGKAYPALCRTAAQTGTSLTETAALVIEQQQP